MSRSNCQRCAATLESDDLRCPVCAQLVPHNDDGAAAVALKIFRCQGCGAAMSWSAEKVALACGFCEGKVELETIADPLEQTEAWLPFRVTAQQAQEALKTWQKSLGFFRPSDLATASKVDSLKPLYWPAWLVDARAEATWTADSNAGSGRSKWAPHSGTAHVDFGGLLVGASRGLSAHEMEALAAAYDPRTQAPAPSPVNQLLDESFDVQRSVARERVAVACSRTAEATIKGGHIPGSTFRKIKVALVLESLSTTRLSLPAWVLAYRYGSEVFRVVIHGQDKAVVVGKAPWSYVKIFLAVVGGVALLALIGTIIALVQRHGHR